MAMTGDPFHSLWITQARLTQDRDYTPLFHPHFLFNGKKGLIPPPYEFILRRVEWIECNFTTVTKDIQMVQPTRRSITQIRLVIRWSRFL